MPRSRTRARVASLHRWLAVLLSPVVALIILSGAVLAFRPILHPVERIAPTSRHVDLARVTAMVARAEAAGPVDFVGLPDDARTIVLAGPRGLTAYDVATGRDAPIPRPQTTVDVFDVAMRVHKDMWFGAGAVVTLASLAMIFLVVAGPFLARFGHGAGPLGRHIRAGWILWPLVALLPLSLVMMKLHLPVVTPSSATRVPLSRTLADVARVADLTRLDGMQRLPGGAAFFIVEEPSGAVRYVYNDGSVRRLDTGVSTLGRALHEGTWAGRWSGMLNLLAAAAMLWMLTSGLLSFARRRTARRGGARVAAVDRVPDAA
ncbi:NAD-binding flavodoxin, putative (plasmid) [Gemmatirosa kalamazoonensis]|uniref:NAD-binding flavodoxin, putative n=1 Tax=Gemmatirosa kalamazoonensis TaxID=861299 RepID=W0RQR7_9BACT|nr:PepSY-associated TM helix domain-containing protein [Gemmatirosa kalamazoonensis]AHG93324.1 NAD-binding flavodoxin, putative [Gemmatirosa kalamazoonensis]